MTRSLARDPSRWEFHGGISLWFPKLEFHRDGLVTFSIQVPNIETGEMVQIRNQEFISDEELKFVREPTSFLDMRVNQLILNVLNHELEEGLWLDGVHVRDPHKQQRRDS